MIVEIAIKQNISQIYLGSQIVSECIPANLRYVQILPPSVMNDVIWEIPVLIFQ